MKLNIHAQDISATRAIEEYVQNELSTALHNLDDYIIDVAIYLRNKNGPNGDVNKSILVSVNLRQRMIVTVDVQRDDLYAAIGIACRQIRRRVKRTIQRQARFDRKALSDAGHMSTR